RLGKVIERFTAVPDGNFPQSHGGNNVVSVRIVGTKAQISPVDVLGCVIIQGSGPGVVTQQLQASGKSLLELGLEGVIAVAGVIAGIAHKLGPSIETVIGPALVGR